jgi:solute carrier family 25 S-adenosylmethionine transporter 26
MATFLLADERTRRGVVTTAPPARTSLGWLRRGRLARPHKSTPVYVQTSGVVTVQPAAPSGRALVDVLAGATARAASQSTIHPLDTLKVRMQSAARGGPACASAGSKYGLGAGGMSSLYKGLGGAAGGAGVAIGTYFAFYGAATRLLERHTTLPSSARAFIAGAAGAVGSSFVKVPAAVCIRSVQANIYPNVIAAATCITRAAGVRGLYTGYLPTVLEDVPDMAVKFAAYESMRAAHARLTGVSRGKASRFDDLCMGGAAGALAAAATTPLDVLKTRMMCAAVSRPTLGGAFVSVLADGKGIKPFFAGVGPRALSNGLNSAVFFCFFEIIRGKLHEMASHKDAAAAVARQRMYAPREAVVTHRNVRSSTALAPLAEASLSRSLLRNEASMHRMKRGNLARAVPAAESGDN